MLTNKDRMVRIIIRLPLGLLENLDLIAREEGFSRNYIINKALREWVMSELYGLSIEKLLRAKRVRGGEKDE